MPYGTIKIDTITFTDGGVDKSVPVSGLVQNPTFTGNITVTGTISGNIIQGGTTVSGLTVTGTTANFASGVFTTQISGVTITGTTVSTTTGNFTSLTGTTATITSGIIASGTAALPSLAILSDPNTGIYSPGADQLAISTNGTGRLFVDASGNVGVGAAPSAVTFGGLDVRSGGLGLVLGADSGAATRTDATTKLGRYLSPHYLNAEEPVAALIASNDSTESIISIGGGTGLANAATTVRFFTAANNTTLSGSERLRITSAGLVGVGTSSPSTNTEINAALDTGASLGLNEGQLSIGREANSGGAIRIGYDTTNNFGFISSGRVGVSWDKLILNAGGGNVGIGDSAPESLLHLKGSSATLKIENSVNTGYSAVEFDRAADDTHFAIYAYDSSHPTQANNVQFYGYQAGRLDFHTNSSASPRLSITSGGNVGIGTQSPDVKLHVAMGNGTGYIKLDGGTSSQATTGILFRSDTNNYQSEVSSYQGNLQFVTGANERARIDSSGRLLVGTTSAPGEGQLLKVSKALSGTEGAGIDFVGAYSLANDASQTINIAHGGLLQITENTNGKAGLLFSTYNSASIVILADPSNIFATSDTAGKLCVFKSANTGAVTVKNRLGATHDIGIAKLTNA